MATGTDPLRRESLVQASGPQARLIAPSSNAAMDLAESLAQFSPEAKRTMAGVAQARAEKATARARADALKSSGAALADAVRAGTLKPTQNPWYIQAYNTESAAIRGRDSLAKLQEDSLSWQEQGDSQAFAKRWHEEVGKVSEQFSGNTDTINGFMPVQAQFTQQTLASNQARNSQRIQTERVANLGQLGTEALAAKFRANGGRITPNEAFNELLPVRQQWFATGGDQQGWENILLTGLKGFARGAKDGDLLKLAQSPELLYGPTAGNGQKDVNSDYSPVRTIELPPSAPGEAPVLRHTLPETQGFTAKPVDFTNQMVSSHFGSRAAPKTGASTYHKGVDIAVPAGTPIKAPSAGRVIFAGKEGDGGNVVRVDHGGGVVSSYAHLGSFNVKVGDVLEAGEVLAASGNTGNSTGAHLHWTVKVDGKAVNPLTFAGKVGGAVEGPSNGRSLPEALSGFPGQDKPFTASGYEEVNNHFGTGPTLYSRPGVAEDLDQQQYYINQSAESEPLHRLRLLQSQRKARAAEAMDSLVADHGTDLLTGNYDRDSLIREMHQKGYSVQEQALVFNDLRGLTGDSIGVQNAAITAKTGSDHGITVMNLAVRGRKEGYSPEYEQDVRSAVLDGTITADDGTSMITGALTQSKQDRAEQRTVDSMTQRRAKQGVDTVAELRAEAGNMAALVLSRAMRHPIGKLDPKYKDPKAQKNLQAYIVSYMQAHLAANPGDYDGALAVGRAGAAAYLRSVSGETSGGPSKSAGQGGPSGPNQRPTKSANPRDK